MSNPTTLSHPITTNTVISKDGTPIHVDTLGDGPSLIVVHGALSTAKDYHVLADTLADSFTVHVMDRRGHGHSGPMGTDYCIGKDVEDVIAVQRQTGAETLFGHSYGGLAALEAARCNEGVKKVAVYEPGVSINGSIPVDWMPAYEAYMAQGRDLDAFVEFVIGMGPGMMKRLPRWPMRRMMAAMFKGEEWETMVTMLPANLIEHREVARLDNTYQNYREISADTLLMSGGSSPESGKQTLRTLAGVIPNARVEIIPKLNHFGPTNNGPEAVAGKLAEWLAVGAAAAQPGSHA